MELKKLTEDGVAFTQVPLGGYPEAAALLNAPTGTTYAYRRFLIFAENPVWIVATKIENDRWVHAQATTSVKDAVAVMSDAGGGNDNRRQVIADCDSKETAKRLIAKEVEADGSEPHVGLFVGQLSSGMVPERTPVERPDAAGIAAARRLASTTEGAKALAAELKRFAPGKGTSEKQLAALHEVLEEVPPDLEQLLRWSNGHQALELMSVEAMIEVNGDLDRDGLFVLNDNENGDYWGIVTQGPLKGALFYDDYSVGDDPPADAVKAASILDWLKHADADE
jgi:hypothetical protein